MTELAEKNQIILLHENEKDIYGDVKERCLEILEYVNSKNLRATFDPANFIQVGEIPYPDAYETLKNFIEYLHIKDAKKETGEVKVAGEGDGNLRKLLSTLKKRNFQGFLSIEPHLDNSQPGGGPENFKKAYKALKNILENI
jgi:sugar phosphate isomerase/epimerase